MHLLKGGSRPNKLRCHFIIRVGDYGREIIDLPIRNENDKPMWLIHPLQEKRAIDIVALPLNHADLKTRVTLLPVKRTGAGQNSHHDRHGCFHSRIPIRRRIASFPVWKRGSIASEPDLWIPPLADDRAHPRSRPGMSGSPVILRSWSNHIPELSNWTINNDNRPVDRIIGVYSGKNRQMPKSASCGTWTISTKSLMWKNSIP